MICSGISGDVGLNIPGCQPSDLLGATEPKGHVCHKSTEAVALGPKTYGWAYPAGEPGLVRISIGVDGIIFMFDGIILQHVTSNLAIFTCLAHNYIIIWPQMQTNINTKL